MNTEVKVSKGPYQQGDRVAYFIHRDHPILKTFVKHGTIISFRDDDWERKNAVTRHYHVNYDDGEFETYESESNLELVWLANSRSKRDDRDWLNTPASSRLQTT